jgi:lipoprotein-anchoring transpeptidase ErfK/SrfK
MCIGICLGLVGVAGPALAQAPYPDPPNIAGVTSPSSGSLQIAYVLPTNTFSYPVTDVEVTTNGANTWSSCGTVDGLCVVGGLTNGLRYLVALRSVNSAGPSQASVNGSGVPKIPAAQNTDKITKLPRSRITVTAAFNAASNNLGVNGAVTRLGVGALPELKFNRDIPNKAVVERHLTVSAMSDVTGETQIIPGRWAWQDARTIIFRPTGWWPGRSTISITSDLDATNLGLSGGATLIGGTTLGTSYSFKTARALVGRVDGKSHMMNVYIDNVKVKSFKISLGGPDWRTRNGVKVINTQKEPAKTYTSEALGLTAPEDQYSLDAKWNTRLTPSGEFMHAALWATSRLGRYNGSHGCTNMNEKDAKWIFDNTIPGDVFIYTNTLGEIAQPGNGSGGLWNIPWASWVRKSALGGLPLAPTIPAPSATPTPTSTPSTSVIPSSSPSTLST